MINYVKDQFLFFIINPFWKRPFVLGLIALGATLSFIIWYLFLTKYKGAVDSTPVAYSLATFILNTFLAIISYPKNTLVSYILLSVGVFVQILILFLLKISIFTGAY